MSEPGYDAREGSGDIETDPAAMGEVSAAEPDGDGGAEPSAGGASGAQQSGREQPGPARPGSA